MKQKFILLVLIAFNLNAQSSFQATYKISYDLEVKKKEINEKLKNDPTYDPSFTLEIMGLNDFYQKNVKIHLIFYENKAVSYYDGAMTSDAFNQTQKDFSKYNFETLYFSDLEKNKYYECYPFYNKNFNIILENINWNVTSETKKINDFVCYLAIHPLTPERKIWFTYDIPISLGPRQFFGAPGLIIEVESYNMTISLESISFKNVKTDKVKMPKGEIVTKQEMDNIAKKARQAQYGRQ